MKFRAFLIALALIVGIAGTSSAAISEHRESTQNLSLAYPVVTLDDSAVADRINTDIQAFAANFRTQYQSGAFFRGELGYRVHLDDANFIAMTCMPTSLYVTTMVLFTTRRRDSVCRSPSLCTSHRPISTVRR